MSQTRALCKFFEQGTCIKGDNCEFSHTMLQVCHMFQSGFCMYGSRCRNEHIGIPSFNSSVPTQQNPADQSICSLAASGNCPFGEKCEQLHGQKCPSCEKHCLHPFRPEEGRKHIELCAERKRMHSEALKESATIECCVCFETVLSKDDPADRKFGIQSCCDHSFCISCIRNWRYPAYPVRGVPAHRKCPTCRRNSHFVIPSDVWYFTKEKKQEIIDRYKEKARFVECKHYRYGNGRCLFEANCFYKHSPSPPQPQMFMYAPSYVYVSSPVFVYVPYHLTGAEMATYTYPYYPTEANSIADITSPDMSNREADITAGTSSSGLSENINYTHVYSHEFSYLLDPYLPNELANITGTSLATYTSPYMTTEVDSNVEASSSSTIRDDSSAEISLNVNVPESPAGNFDVNDV